jgi:uncharacterized protein YjbI with pentapeptide repeats
MSFKLDVHGAFLRRTDLSFTNLERANLSRADFSGALFRGANFKDAILDGTVLRGADLTGAINLTVDQLGKAIIDGQTILPANMSLDGARAAA